MSEAPRDGRWTVDQAATLGDLLRERCEGVAYNAIKRAIATGKVTVDGAVEVRPTVKLRPGAVVELRMAARRVGSDRASVRIVYEDPHVVVIDKPSGVSSVPYHEGERDTAVELIREAWRKRGLKTNQGPVLTVHRIDKETSGLLVFARTKLAERALGAQLRAHEMDRLYRCVAHGDVTVTRVESMLVDDRGDGLRGTARSPEQRRRGKRAITHIKPLRPLPGATECEVRLETGKTHQIRIHLSEQGHPLVGEKVYIRDWLREEHAELPSPRLLLHAETLGFEHPVGGHTVRFESPLPQDWLDAVAALERRRPRS